MHSIDLVVIASYLLGCIALGWWLGSDTKSLNEYFLGERSIPAWAVMISIVATETSTATFLSVPGVAYKVDLTYLQLPIGYLFGRVIVAMLLLPSYFRGRIETAYQVLGHRFGTTTRRTASLLFLVTRSLSDGLRLFLAAKVLQLIAGSTIGTAILVMAAATIVYTYLGGMKAVVWADVLQFAIYMVGALIALLLLVGKLPGGWTELIDRGQDAHKFRMFDFSFDPTRAYTFWAGLIGGMVLNTATHGVDQIMVQRYLSARSQRAAAGALVASGLVVLIQFALFLLIGVGLFAFYQVDPPSGMPLAPDDAFATFIVGYLPVGVKGLVIAAIFAAAMSTLSGSLNASASAVVNDLYRPITGCDDERTLLRLSRGLTVAWGAVQAAVAMGATQLEDSVVNNALAIASFATGILLGLFLLGILTSRVGQRAALVGMVAGISAVSFAKFGTSLAWPWYALVGSSTVFAVGLAASYLRREPVLEPSTPTAASNLDSSA
ncbi:Sodium/glucose cotransporter [Aquisphaera giovannonii]|uniref:Sodium/glucose cotransporter n=1 Tax=Aquisphaera giovannonii TaxID=406548 RepID=A0A5B9WBM4_9BACT|nr:sodium:solute symporter [Aquisphaera giovannonii]QEH38078.1 Sodium/glucose cotransporter [Aquisphaera giovannonii]